MSHRIRTRKDKAAPQGSTRAKADLLEQMIADIHQTPGVKVERNVFLPVQDGSSRTREIDVLLTSQVAGYSVRVAIECKNERAPAGIEAVDEFVGRLQDVGIPTQHGIFVSTGGYRSGAISRAQKAGIIPLVLQDLTTKLPVSIQQAFQSLVYLLLTITNVEVRTNAPDGRCPEQILSFRNQLGQICGTVPDLVWQDWLSGKIPGQLGDHQVHVSLPDGWLQVVNDRVAVVSGIKVDIRISGHVIRFEGNVRHLALVDVTNQRLRRCQIDMRFSPPSGTCPVVSLSTEEELEDLLHPNGGLAISVGRFRVPRIVWNGTYWPPSEASVQKTLRLMRAFEEGNIPDPRPFSLAEIEGNDFSEAWKPIWAGHPLAKYPKENT